MTMMTEAELKASLLNGIKGSMDVKASLLADEAFQDTFVAVVQKMVATLQAGGRLLFCGNGGSAGDAQHIAAELSGRFYLDRPAMDAEALHVNPSYLTAVANDYGYETVFARATEAKGRAGDCLIGITTSGNSGNVLRAMEKAKEMGMWTVGMTGQGGGKAQSCSDYLLAVPSTVTPRIQEAHILIGHMICEQVEHLMFGNDAV